MRSALRGFVALRLVYEAARWGLRMQGLVADTADLGANAPVPTMSFLDGRKAFEAAVADDPEMRAESYDAPLAVFVHGLGSSVVTWSPVLPEASHTAPVVAPDLPGYGRTPLPKGVHFATLKDQVAAVHSFLDHVAPDGMPVQLVGQSMGGWIATRVAAERPDQVKRLTLVNAAGILHPQVFEQRRLFSPSGRRELRELWRRMWHRLPPSYYVFERRYLELTRTPVVRGFLETLDQDDFLNDVLPDVKAPTLLVWGLSDHLISYESVRYFREGLRDVRYRPIPDCGHVAQRERTPLFLSYLLPWLRGEEPPEPERPGLAVAEAAAVAEAEAARERAMGDPEVVQRIKEAVAAGLWHEDR